MINTTQIIRGESTSVSTSGINNIFSQGSTQNTVNNPGAANHSSFDSYLINAMDYVNEKQQVASDISTQLITDPDSVDVHDVTIAMAEANLTLSLAQSVITRLTQAWSEITTTR
ncbi:MAG: flagellar hook-basal body complex protein FliE [Spirochaetales bacterium]